MTGVPVFSRADLCQNNPMRLLVLAPILLLLVLFALSNATPVRLGLWPTGWSLEAPLSLAILGAMALAFLIGGLLVWITELGQRRRARRAEETVRLLEAQVQELRSRLPRAALGPPVG
jgi:putative membrane protein